MFFKPAKKCWQWMAIACISFLVTVGMTQYYYVIRGGRSSDVIRSSWHTSLPTPVQPINNSVPLILVVAYFRSGSSLTGELFAVHKKSFYLFEPSRADYIDWMTPHDRLLNATLDREFPFPVRLDDVTKPLTQMFECSFSQMAKEYALNPFYWYRSAYPGVKPFVKCAEQRDIASVTVLQCYKILESTCPLNVYTIIPSCFTSLHEARVNLSSSSDSAHSNITASSVYQAYVKCTDDLYTRISPCVEHLENSCKMAATRAVKAIRLDLTFVRELLRTSSFNIKVVHLVRDPRGMLLSRKVTQNSPLTTKHALKTCVRLSRNVHDFRSMELEFPGTFLQVRYEDFVTNLVDTARLIYRHSAMDAKLAKEYLKIWLRKTKDPTNKGIFNTYRSNSTAEAYDWQKKLSPRDRKLIESIPECSRIIRQLNYPIQ